MPSMTSHRSEKVTFEGSQGATLAARLDHPVGTARAYALFAHCFTCSKDVFAASRISRALADQGIAVLRFDFTGLGHSDGEFANTNFSSNVEDLVAAAAFLRAHHQAPALLIGHSLGGTAVLAAAPRIAETTGVVTINAPYDPAHVAGLLGEAVPEIEAAGEAEVTIAGRAFQVRQQLLDDLSEQQLEPVINRLGKSLLVFHTPQDHVVDVDNARRIFETARHPKSFVSLDGADHLLTRREDATYVATTLAAWASRYLPAPAPADSVTPGGTVLVEESGDGRYTQHIQSGRHVLTADEPAGVGGDDIGPSPYQLLLASLGACTSMTLRMYAERKGWPVEHIAVELSHEKIHAEDCAECETRTGRVDAITRAIALAGPLDAEQRQRLLEIADKCPVHRTLTSEVRITTRLEDEPE